LRLFSQVSDASGYGKLITREYLTVRWSTAESIEVVNPNAESWFAALIVLN